MLLKALKSWVGSRDASNLPRPDGDEFGWVADFTMVDRVRLRNLHNLARYVVSNGVPGDVVECGTWNGGSAAVTARAIGEVHRPFWLYDSFVGMPVPGDLDGEAAKQWAGKCVGSPERVREILSVAGQPADLIRVKKGWFLDTFAEPLPECIAYLHIDADWFESVKLALDTFYDRVSDGGVIILDDFGYWEGCREAFYDFCRRRDLKPLLERCGSSQASWVKGRTHNRDQ